MKPFIFIALAAMVASGLSAGYQAHQALPQLTGTSSQFQSHDSYGNYQFGYDIDQASGSLARHEEDLDGVKRGSYSVVNPDGLHRIVNYIADEHGFRASVLSNEPGVESSRPADVRIEDTDFGSTGFAYRYNMNSLLLPPPPSKPQTAPVLQQNNAPQRYHGPFSVTQQQQQQYSALMCNFAPLPIVPARDFGYAFHVAHTAPMRYKNGGYNGAFSGSLIDAYNGAAYSAFKLSPLGN